MLSREAMLSFFKTKTAGRQNSVLLIMACLSLGACSSPKQSDFTVDTGSVIYDPNENFNRKMMSFNMAVDHAVINPVIEGYRTVAPPPARSGIRNFLRNLRTPVNLANQILQGDLQGTHDTLVRGIVNTTVGLGGLFDVAGHEGIEYESEDFGQTLAVWGVGHGPYMVVPFIGASSLRDYSGYFVDSFADPLRWYLFNIDEKNIYYAKFGMDYLDIRDSLYDTLSELERSSFDYYAAVRSTYYQHRRALVYDNKPASSTELPDIPDFDDDL